MSKFRIPARVRGPARDLNRTSRAQEGSWSAGSGHDNDTVHLFFAGKDGEFTRFALTRANAALLGAMLLTTAAAQPAETDET